jgi:hypothetical protein
MRAQTQAAPCLQSDCDSFDTTGLPLTPFVNFNLNFGVWSAFLLLSKLESREKTLRRMVLAPMIECYIPPRFHKLVKWTPPTRRGKVLEFPAEIRKSA